MSLDTIVLASTLLLVAFGLIAVAAAIVWKGKRDSGPPAVVSRPEIPRVLAVSDEDLSETVLDSDDERAQDDSSGTTPVVEELRILKVIELPFGAGVEIVVDVDPNQHPASFKAKTLEEAKENALGAVRMRAAIRNTFPDF